MTQRFSIYRRLFAYLRPYPWHVVAAYGGMLFATLLNLFIPQIIKEAIDQGLDEGNPSQLYWAAAMILGIAVIRGIAGFLTMYNGEWITFRVAYALRDDFFRAVQTLPFAFHDKAHTGDLMSRATGDISETERFAGTGMVQLVSVILLTIGVVTAMFLEEASLAILAMIPIYRACCCGVAPRPRGRTNVAHDPSANGRALNRACRRASRVSMWSRRLHASRMSSQFLKRRTNAGMTSAVA